MIDGKYVISPEELAAATALAHKQGELQAYVVMTLSVAAVGGLIGWGIYSVFTKTKRSDAASELDTNFQTSATEIMTKIVDLHHDLMFFLTAIVLFVS